MSSNSVGIGNEPTLNASRRRVLAFDLDGTLAVTKSPLSATMVDVLSRALDLFEVIEDRGSHITFSALGQQAPPDRKHHWDPDGAKKEALRAAVARLVPDLDMRAGGTTSIDVTRHGIDKRTACANSWTSSISRQATSSTSATSSAMILDLARFEARTDERIPAAWTRSPPYDLTGLLALLGQTVTPSEPVTKKVIALGL